MNDEKKLKAIKQNMKFADSLETIKAQEKSIKQEKIKATRDRDYSSARRKLKLQPNEKFFKYHAAKLTLQQMKVIVSTCVHCVRVLIIAHAHIRLWGLSNVAVFD